MYILQAAQSGVSSVEKEKILLVDNDPAILRICTLYLRAEDYEVVSLNKPEELMTVARQEKPDLVILDINIPIAPAIKSLQEFRGEKLFQQIPLLVLFGSEKARNIIYENQDLLPDDHLAKPFVAEELVARIHALLRAKKIIEKACAAPQLLKNLVNLKRNHGESRGYQH